MNRHEYNAVITEALSETLSKWGPIQWRNELQDFAPDPDPELSRLFLALADLEDVAFYLQGSIRRGGVTRFPAIREFNAVWLAEESEHTRALAELGSRYGSGQTRRPARHRSSYRLRQAISELSKVAVARLFPRAVLGAYLVIGTAQEYIALSTYAVIVRTITEPAVSGILHEIARQEARHMRFYRTGAEAVLADSKFTQRAMRYLVNTTWTPPDFGLLGSGQWISLFGSYVTAKATRERYLRLDTIMQGLPGMGSVSLMGRFLDHTGLKAEKDAAVFTTNREIAEPA